MSALKIGRAALDVFHRAMTNVEALLSVESGRIPDGVEVFYEQDPDAPRFRAWLLLAGVMGVVTTLTAMHARDPNTAHWEVALMGLFTSFAMLMAMPTHEDDERAARRRVLVISGRGLITRDPWGLQNWDFEELARVSRCWVAGQPHILLEDKQGKEHLLDVAPFASSDRIMARIELRVGTVAPDCHISPPL